MSRILASTAVLIALAAPAFATGYVAPAAAPAPVPVPVATSDWTGFYAGVGIGTYHLEEFNTGTAQTDTFEGSQWSLFVGYLHDLGDIVVGAEAFYLSTGDLDTSFATVNTFSETQIGLRARVGYDMGAALPYASIGVLSRDSIISTGFDLIEDTMFTVGLGLDYQVSDSIRVGAHYERAFDDEHLYGGSALRTDLVVQTLSLRVMYNF